jgi:hypothetical protein
MSRRKRVIRATGFFYINFFLNVFLEFLQAFDRGLFDFLQPLRLDLFDLLRNPAALDQIE